VDVTLGSGVSVSVAISVGVASVGVEVNLIGTAVAGWLVGVVPAAALLPDKLHAERSIPPIISKEIKRKKVVPIAPLEYSDLGTTIFQKLVLRKR
jgi:hypothetical protein